MSNQFFIILPSNTSSSYENNQPNRYRVHLPRTLDFSGNWSVGMHSISYDYSWDNLGTLEQQYLALRMDNDQIIRYPIPNSSFATPESLEKNLLSNTLGELDKHLRMRNKHGEALEKNRKEKRSLKEPEKAPPPSEPKRIKITEPDKPPTTVQTKTPLINPEIIRKDIIKEPEKAPTPKIAEEIHPIIPLINPIIESKIAQPERAPEPTKLTPSAPVKEKRVEDIVVPREPERAPEPTKLEEIPLSNEDESVKHQRSIHGLREPSRAPEPIEQKFVKDDLDDFDFEGIRMKLKYPFYNAGPEYKKNMAYFPQNLSDKDIISLLKLIGLYYLPDVNKFMLEFSNPFIKYVTLSPQIGYLLGFENPERIENREIAKYSADLKGGINSFGVYAKGLTENIICGSELVSLLRVVTISGQHKFGDTIEQIYTAPLYLKVLPKQISEVEIELRTMGGQGRLIPFQFGTTHITLIFKKVINF